MKKYKDLTAEQCKDVISAIDVTIEEYKNGTHTGGKCALCKFARENNQMWAGEARFFPCFCPWYWFRHQRCTGERVKNSSVHSSFINELVSYRIKRLTNWNKILEKRLIQLEQ